LTRRAPAIAKYLVPLIIGFFIARVIYRNWQQVREAEWVFDPVFLLLSFALTAPWFLLRPWAWQQILRRFGYSIPYHSAYRIVRRAELSRFVPGGIWHYVSRVYLASQWGVAAPACLAATFIETVILLLAAILPALWSLNQALPVLDTPFRVLLVVVPLVAFGALHPRVLNFWAAFVARRLKQPHAELHIRWRTLVSLWLLFLVIWLTYALSAGLFIRGILLVPGEWVPAFSSNYVLAWLVGMVTMIAPAGMGIRDGVLGLLLRGHLAIGAGLTVAVALRLWTTVVEVFWAVGLEQVVQRFSSGDPPETLR
jgi:uncharacterized membrane protein YbhN (UPF0104 family)